MRNHPIVRALGAAAATLLLWGCSSANSGAPAQNPTSGQHPANWVNTHWSDATTNPASCVPCHGSATDSTNAGGTSGVSCFACHHLSGPSHPQNWSDWSQHGLVGAEAKYNVAFTMQGFTDCTPCHGTDFKTTLSSNVPSCYACHTKAPHPDAPWMTSPTTLSAPNHDQTDPSNAGQCITCHKAGSAINNTLGITVTTPAANAEPGCFNATMCHGNVT